MREGGRGEGRGVVPTEQRVGSTAPGRTMKSLRTPSPSGEPKSVTCAEAAESEAGTKPIRTYATPKQRPRLSTFPARHLAPHKCALLHGLLRATVTPKRALEVGEGRYASTHADPQRFALGGGDSGSCSQHDAAR